MQTPLETYNQAKRVKNKNEVFVFPSKRRLYGVILFTLTPYNQAKRVKNKNEVFVFPSKRRLYGVILFTLTPYNPGASEYGELGQEIKKVLDYLMSPHLQESLFPLQIIFFLISIFFFLSIIYFLTKSNYLEWNFLKFFENFFSPEFSKSKIIKKWNKIKSNLEKSELETQWKIYILEALAFLDESIKKMGYSGNSLDERLKNMFAARMYNTDEVFRAQKFCENIIQNPDYPVNKKQGQKICEIFEKLLIDLKVL